MEAAFLHAEQSSMSYAEHLQLSQMVERLSQIRTFSWHL